LGRVSRARKEKHELRIVPAWQIDLNDLDIARILEEDDPVVPEGAADIPFERVRAWKAKRRGG